MANQGILEEDNRNSGVSIYRVVTTDVITAVTPNTDFEGRE
jgi:hypothetical protein